MQELDNGRSQEQTINLGETVHRYVYRWPIFFATVLLCLACSYLYLRYTTPIYEVTSKLLIKQDKGTSTDLVHVLEQGGANQNGVDNEIIILKSRTLMSKVVDRLHLNTEYKNEGRLISSNAYGTRPINFIAVKFNKEYYRRDLIFKLQNPGTYSLEDPMSGVKVSGPLNRLHRTVFGVYKVIRIASLKENITQPLMLKILDPTKVVNDCLANLTVENKNANSTIVDLNYTTPVVKQGEDILNTLVQVYNEASLMDKNKTVGRTLEFINEKLKPISGELNSVEKQVENFKSSEGITDMGSQADLYLESLKANDVKLADLNIKMAVVKDIQRYINSNSSREKLPATIGIDDPQILSQITQLSQLLLQKDELLATTPAENPIFDPINRQIESIRATIRLSINNLARVLNRTKTQIQIGNNAAEVSIKKIPGQERVFVGIKRQQETKEALYLYLLQKQQETELSYAAAVADSRLIDPAFGTGIPVKPNQKTIYLAALLLGLLLPILYIYISDLFNNKIATMADLTKLTKANVIGELIFERDSEAIVVDAKSRSAIAEQFRAIRTNLQFLQGKPEPGRGRVTLFTSSVSGEGKSFVGTNLGMALAISGRKTIILELDLRKPKVVKYLNLTSKVGLSNYLIGKASYEELLLNSGSNPNLFVMGSGPIPPNPSELLMKVEMDDLIERLRTEFDEIIIDAPPVGLVTDSQILARLADITLYIVRQGITYKRQVSQFDILYRQGKFPKMHLILNGILLGGQYGYGYGYGYGYYADDVKKGKRSLKDLVNDFLQRFKN